MWAFMWKVLSYIYLEEDQEKFAFTWDEQKYTLWSRLRALFTLLSQYSAKGIGPSGNSEESEIGL